MSTEMKPTQPPLIPAAVLIPLLFDSSTSASNLAQLKTASGLISLPQNTKVLLTVRTDKVEHHKGQISFPGGALEPNDPSLEHAALRESHEEIGLDPRAVKVVAELPQIPTRGSLFTIKPFVGLVEGKVEFSPNPDEIQEMIFVPLAHLLDPANSVMEAIDVAAGSAYPPLPVSSLFERAGLLRMKAFHFNSHRIWGATGFILQTFIEKFLS